MNKSFFLFFVVVCCSCTQQPSVDYYNLSLSRSPLEQLRWNIYLGDTIKWAPLWMKDPEINEQVFCVEEIVSRKTRHLPCAFEMAQRFPLFSPYKKADIRIHVREEYVKEAWLKVCALNEREEIVCMDSVRISGGKWQEQHIPIGVDSASYLLVHLRVKSVPEASAGAKIWIDRIDIRLDGQSVNDVSRPDQGETPALDPDRLVPLSFSDDSLMANIPQLQTNPRIIGLGSTMSGSLSLGRAKNQMIKWLVEHKNCKLVVLDVPSLIPLKWDLYIQGYSLSLQEIVEDAANTTLTREEIMELLEFLKTYNSNTTKKVRIVGIDRNIKDGDLLFLMCSYLFEIYKRNPAPPLRAFLENIPSIPFSDNSLLEECIGRFEVKWLESIADLVITERELPGVKEYGVLNFRGTILWEHLSRVWHLAALSKDECMVIVGHGIQLYRKSSPTMYLSLGEKLADSYGKDYCAIGLLGGHGTVTSVRLELRKTDQNCPLPEPEEGSLEKGAWNTDCAYFYYPADSLPQHPISIRSIPLSYELRDWLPANLRERMDGFIFVRESTGGESLRGEVIPFDNTKEAYRKKFKQLAEYYKTTGIKIPSRLESYMK